MKRYFESIIIVISVTFILISCEASEAQTNIVEAFPNLTFSNPVDIQTANDSSNRLFILEQQGRIKVINNHVETQTSSTFLDISSNVLFGGEQGLLGLAFHPNFKENGYFYLDYTASNPRRTIISRFKTNGDNSTADPQSELIILEVEQPYSNHNGGQISFGPDGFLYISLGDGGSGGDPENRAQNLSTLLGKILRIDVNQITDSTNYLIPSDNPFVNNENNYREEIYAYGLRNVWRFSFDSQNRLWAADVGQNAWEEINLIEKGGNYGWRIMEGLHCYNPSSNCDQEGLELPIWEYDHSSTGGFSITGGHFYESDKISELENKYVYGDFVSGNIWLFDPTNSENPNKLFASTSHQISTFGTDENNELYFANYSSGKIYKFIDDDVNSIKKTNSNRTGFMLNQNYPNPFNPSTNISYELFE